MPALPYIENFGLSFFLLFFYCTFLMYYFLILDKTKK